MLCPNCQGQNAENSGVCVWCGAPLVAQPQMQAMPQQPQPMMPQQPTQVWQPQQQMPQPMMQAMPQRPRQSTFGEFFKKYKKQILIGGGAVAAMFIGVFLFSALWDFTEIDWDPENGDSDVTMTTARTLNLNVLARDKEGTEISEIKFAASDGEVEAEGTSAIWTLPNAAGEYTIVAEAPSGKKIEKSVRKIVDGDGPLAGVDDEEESGTEIVDTDGDGLSDDYEKDVSKTDPKKADTDGDGVDDGDELDLGLDPLKADSKGDGVKDGERTLGFALEENRVKVELTGKGNIASTTVDVFSNETLANTDGVIGLFYNFNTKGKLDTAKATIPYGTGQLEVAGIKDEKNLTLFSFDDETKELTPVETTVDTSAHTITATLTHFSKYVIGDKNAKIVKADTNIFFLIDNSTSMYTEAQLRAAGYDLISGADGNDKNFKRLSLTKKLIDMFSGDEKFGVGEFSGNFARLQRLDQNRTAAKSAVDEMNTNWSTNGDGTAVFDALENGVSEFAKDSDNNYLIILTDGKDNASTAADAESIIAAAKSANVKICAVGLGEEIDTEELSEIASKTGCGYYNASDASALDEIYERVGADINYGYTDTDGDGKTDGVVIADSGFLAKRDGFSFANFGSNKSPDGHCFGMAMFAMLYYEKELPMKLGEKEVRHLLTKEHADGYDLSGTYFSTFANLYGFKASTAGLKDYLSMPADYRDRVDEDVWMIKEDYYKEMGEVGAQFSIKDWKGEKEDDFSKYQSAQLQINDDTLRSRVTKAESSMLDALWRLFILQWNGNKHYSFSADPDESFDKLKRSLVAGKPMLTVVNHNHAINAIRLLQDNEDANKFKLEVYDNNFPGETQYITITRTKFNKVQLSLTAWTNEYKYTFDYDHDNDGTASKNIPVEMREVTVE